MTFSFEVHKRYFKRCVYIKVSGVDVVWLQKFFKELLIALCKLQIQIIVLVLCSFQIIILAFKVYFHALCLFPIILYGDSQYVIIVCIDYSTKYAMNVLNCNENITQHI